MYRAYEAVFNGKVEHFKNNPAYPTFRKNADWCIINHRGFGYNAIKAHDYIERIILMPLSRIEKYLDGKDDLKFTNGENGMLDHEYNKMVVDSVFDQLPLYKEYYKEK